jgi:hypothetical protein
MAQTPLELLTFIAAPALITNASSVLVLSTSNRFARTVDRSRILAAELAKAESGSHARMNLLEQHVIVRRRTRILVRTLTSFYTAVGSFASGTFSGLVGAAMEHFGLTGIAAALTGLALAAVTVGTLAIAAGAVMLVAESRMALQGLAVEDNRR